VQRVLFAGVKRPRRDADRLAIFGVEVKNGANIPTLSFRHKSHGVVLNYIIKYGNKFIFTM
jgi:hypothetical protein